MSGTSSSGPSGPSGSSGLSGNPSGLSSKTAITLGKGLAGALAKAPSGEKTSPPSSPPRETGDGVAFVRSSTRGSVASSPPSPTQGGSQEPSARGGGGDADECNSSECVAKKVAEAGPPPLSQGFLKAFRPKKPSAAEEENQRKHVEILTRVEEARKKQAEEKAAAEALAIAKAAAQAMVDQVTSTLDTLASNGFSPLDLLTIVGIFMYMGDHPISARLEAVLEIFETILQLVGGPFLQRQRANCQCILCRVQYFMQMFDPNPVPDPEIELERLFWRRAFGIQDFREDLSSFGGQIFSFLRFQEERILTTRRLDMLFSLMVVDLGGEFGGGHQDPPPRAPKAMPPITPTSDACPFVPCSPECVICMGQLSGQCLMPQCRHALHSRCMTAMFESGIDICPLCREQIQTLVSATLEESPKASDDSSAGGASADAAPESPKASDE